MSQILAYKGPLRSSETLAWRQINKNDHFSFEQSSVATTQNRSFSADALSACWTPSLYCFEKCLRIQQPILGLDPAMPFFCKNDKSGRLDPSDAQYVQVVHTCAGFLGVNYDMGHADYYANDGRFQPGCYLDLVGNDNNLIFTHRENCDVILLSRLQESPCSFFANS